MRHKNLLVAFGFLCEAVAAGAPAPTATEPLMHLVGTDFTGGVKEHYLAVRYGEQVNCIYAQPTGSQATMRATFVLERVPHEAQFLHLRARDDDGPQQCSIELKMNGTSLLRGPNPFTSDAFELRRIAVPAGLLIAGTNELVIANIEKSGEANLPPWFILASCTIAPGDYEWKRDAAKDFFVTLPDAPRPFPEPLTEGQAPGFRIRGIKGYNWTAEQYLAEIPVLVRYKMNFLMNCYLSMYSGRPDTPADKPKNEWWLPLSDVTTRDYEKVIRACRQSGIQFCFSIHPQLDSPRPLDMTSDKDFEQFWQHFAWAQGLGVKWFNVPIDDVTHIKVDGAEHARFANRVLQRLRAHDPEAQLVFCPTQYCGDGAHSPYLEALGRELHEDVYLFWTGDGIVTPRVTRRCAESYKRVVGHRLILWDNYPVNDGKPTMHLGPVIGRAPDLGEIVDGYMANSMYPQNQINRVPLLTCADYAYNPRAYDPARSIGQAIVHLADTAEQRRVLKEVVEAYPGMLIWYPWSQEGMEYREQQTTNPVCERYFALASQPHPRSLLDTYLHSMEDLAARFDRAFPGQFSEGKKSLGDDIARMRQAFADRYGREERE